LVRGTVLSGRTRVRLVVRHPGINARVTSRAGQAAREVRLGQEGLVRSYGAQMPHPGRGTPGARRTRLCDGIARQTGVPRGTHHAVGRSSGTGQVAQGVGGARDRKLRARGAVAAGGTEASDIDEREGSRGLRHRASRATPPSRAAISSHGTVGAVHPRGALGTLGRPGERSSVSRGEGPVRAGQRKRRALGTIELRGTVRGDQRRVDAELPLRARLARALTRLVRVGSIRAWRRHRAACHAELPGGTIDLVRGGGSQGARVVGPARTARLRQAETTAVHARRAQQAVVPRGRAGVRREERAVPAWLRRQGASRAPMASRAWSTESSRSFQGSRSVWTGRSRSEVAEPPRSTRGYIRRGSGQVRAGTIGTHGTQGAFRSVAQAGASAERTHGTSVGDGRSGGAVAAKGTRVPGGLSVITAEITGFAGRATGVPHGGVRRARWAKRRVPRPLKAERPGRAGEARDAIMRARDEGTGDAQVSRGAKSAPGRARTGALAVLPPRARHARVGVNVAPTGGEGALRAWSRGVGCRRTVVPFGALVVHEGASVEGDHLVDRPVGVAGPLAVEALRAGAVALRGGRTGRHAEVAPRAGLAVVFAGGALPVQVRGRRAQVRREHTALGTIRALRAQLWLDGAHRAIVRRRTDGTERLGGLVLVVARRTRCRAGRTQGTLVSTRALIIDVGDHRAEGAGVPLATQHGRRGQRVPGALETGRARKARADGARLQRRVVRARNTRHRLRVARAPMSHGTLHLPRVRAARRTIPPGLAGGPRGGHARRRTRGVRQARRGGRRARGAEGSCSAAGQERRGGSVVPGTVVPTCARARQIRGARQAVAPRRAHLALQGRGAVEHGLVRSCRTRVRRSKRGTRGTPVALGALLRGHLGAQAEKSLRAPLAHGLGKLVLICASRASRWSHAAQRTLVTRRTLVPSCGSTAERGGRRAVRGAVVARITRTRWSEHGLRAAVLTRSTRSTGLHRRATGRVAP